MCPQANVSTALLQGNFYHYTVPQRGEQTVSVTSQMKSVMFGYRGMLYQPTVGGYLMAMLDRPDTIKETIPFMSFLSDVHKTNKFIPTNLLLLCGDSYLDGISKRLEQERLLPPPNYEPWKRITLYMKDFIEGVVSNDPSHTYTFFIDTSSSFSIYTEMAISAAKRLIVPFMADDFSLKSIKSMLYYVYGYECEDTSYIYRQESVKQSQYFWLAKHNGIRYPMLHLFVNNRATFYKGNPAFAYAAIGDIVEQILKNVYNNCPDIFEMQLLEYPPNPDPVLSFRRRYMFDLHDFHTMAIISIHHGCPISQLKPTGYYMSNGCVKVSENDPGLISYKKDIFDIVKML